MNRFRPPSFSHLAYGAFFLFVTAVSPTRAQQPAPATPPPVGFYTGRATLWLGRLMVLPFRVARAPASDETVSASAADATALEILRPPTVLAGETTGFLRVRGLRAGKMRLILHGDAVLELDIRPDPAAAIFGLIDAESGQPRIVSPVPDAAVWGQFAVGVEVFDANFHAALPPESPARPLASPAGSATPVPPTPPPTPTPTLANTIAHGGLRVQLRLPGGLLLDPAAATGPELGPVRQFLFNVRAEDFLRALCRWWPCLRPTLLPSWTVRSAGSAACWRAPR